MEHKLRIEVRFVVDNYVAHDTQRLVLRSHFTKESQMFLERKDAQWEVSVDITDILAQADRDGQSAKDLNSMRTYRYVVLNEDGSEAPDVLERTLPHIPGLQSIYDQCLSALVLHANYETLVANKENVLDVRFTLIDDWSFSASSPWNTAAMRVMISHNLKEESSVLNSNHLLNKLFNRCFWRIDDSLDTTDSNTTSLLEAASRHHGAPEKLIALKVTKYVKEVESKKARSSLIRSDTVVSNLVPILFSCTVPYIFKGERVVMTGNLPRFGNWNPHSKGSVTLHHVGDRRFEAPTVFYLTMAEIKAFQFKYVICHSKDAVSFESGENRSIKLIESTCTVTVSPEATGKDGGDGESNFSDVNGIYASVASSSTSNLLSTQQINISKELDDDKDERSIDNSNSTEIPLKTISDVPAVSYTKTKRQPKEIKIKIKYYSYFLCSFFRYPYVAMPRFTSLCVPLFSLRSALSTGVGDFGDLRMLANFAECCGINIIQLLPLQDTISGPILSAKGENTLNHPFLHADASPYSSISVFALHPIYIRLEKIQGMDSAMTRQLNDFRHKMTRDISYLHCKYKYGRVCREKLNFLYLIYKSLCETGGLEKQVTEIVDWIEKTPYASYWIYPYMLYRYLVDVFADLRFLDESADMTRQNAKLAAFYDVKCLSKTSAITPRDSSLYIKTLYSTFTQAAGANKDTGNAIRSIMQHIFFYGFMQMHAHRQLMDSANYCRSKGICLKGDLSFGTSLASVDFWLYPEYFSKTRVVGAPPDQFSSLGQNWGYPAYDWEEMERVDKCEWMRMRLKQYELYFDCIRIDHIFGWFRMWTLSRTASCHNGSLGQFVPAAPLHWDWIFDECYDPKSPISWCRSKDEIRRRLTAPLLTQELAHKLCNPSGDLACKRLVELGILSYDRQHDSYLIISTEQDACKLLDSLLAERKITPDFYSRILEALYKLIGNVCILNDTTRPDTYCHPVFANKNVGTEALSLTTLEHEGLRNKIRHWSYEYFTTWHNDEWTNSGTKHLNLITQTTNLMICGEDLGYLHPCIRKVMAAQGIIGLRVQRMAHEGYPIHAYRCDDESVYSYLTVASPSTHDTYPLRAWWEHNRSAACAFWKENLGRGSDSDWQISRSLSEFDCRSILRQNLHSKSIICCLMLQDIFGACDKYRYNGATKDEVINTPKNGDNNWSYRIHISLEELHNSDLVGIVGDEIANSGRISY